MGGWFSADNGVKLIAMGDTRNKFLDDLTSLAAGAVGAAQAVGDDMRRAISAQIDKIAAERGFVSREEFEIVRDMAQKAREENEALRAELAKLTKTKPKKTAKKTKSRKSSE